MNRTAKIIVGILFWPLGAYWLARHFGASMRAGIAIAVGSFVLAVVLIAALPDSSTKNASPGTTTKTTAPAPVTTQPVPPPPPTGPSEKAVKAREHGQAFYDQAQACVIAFVIAGSSETDLEGAENFIAAKNLCENIRSELASVNTDDIDDETLTLWAAVDEAKQGCNSAINYLDTQAPSKLADYKSHLQNASSYLKQGKRELNARLRELGAKPIKA